VTDVASETTTASPRPRTRLRARLTSTHPAVVVLAGLGVTWFVTFSILVVMRHDRFWDFDFDMGLYDQAIWLVAHGRGFITVRGLPVFGHHATFAFYLLVPFSWLGAGPNFLNVFQVATLALATVPLYLLARQRNFGQWASAALASAFLLHPATQFLDWELFHPETVAITPLLCAYLCAVRRSWRWFAFWAVLAVSWKEDVALAVVVIGLLIAWRGDRKIGLVVAGAALGWFLGVSQVLLPLVSGHAAHYDELYQGVGGSTSGILHTALHHPSVIANRIVSSESGDFAWRLLAPFGLVPLAALGPLAVGIPQFLSDVSSDVIWTRVITYHYVAIPLAAAALGTIDAVGMLGRRLGRALRAVLPVIVLVSSICATVAWGPSPIGAEYRSGRWPLGPQPRVAVQQRAVDLVPDDASVSASYSLVSHLSHRPEIYTFPNPWRRSNYGVTGTKARSPDRIEWLVIDRDLLGSDQALFDSIVASGSFTTVYDAQSMVVLHRIRP
jgi:uncharacterized membrane protein